MIYGMLLWIGGSSLIGCALALLQGELTPWISLVSLLVGLGVSVLAARKRSGKVASSVAHTPFAAVLAKMPLPEGLLYLIIVVGIYFHSVFLFFKKNGMLFIQNPFNLGDMSFHWGTIRYLAKGAHFWPENPIFLGHRFRYPFGMDFFNAFFENLHIPMATHLPLVTLACLLLTLCLLHSVGGPLLVFAVFFGSGFYNVFQAGAWDLTQIQAGLDFKNLFLSILLTQRGFLFALPATLFLYQALQRSFDPERKMAFHWSEKIGLGIIWGALGFFHLHTYAFVSLFFGLWILWQRQWRTWFWTLLIAALVGLPFVLNAVWPEPGMNSLMHWSRGWSRPEGRDVFSYWIQNVGPWIVAMVGALIVLYKRKNWKAFVPQAFIAFLFVLFAHLILAPWDWDNIKLLFWCYIFGLLLMKEWLWNLRSAQAKAAVFAVFFGPGFLLFVHSLPLFTHGIAWTSAKELEKAEVLLAGHDVNLGILIAPEYEHPALLLGHKLYMGYTGHVWSHGYNYSEREALMSRYFAGDLTVLPELSAEGVKLFYQGPLEKKREGAWQPTPGLFKMGIALDHELYKIE
jgi:hypothetical protein